MCCSSYLEKFEPVSIRMAKEQSLSLNPTKISGQCGRLMCCLVYEYETYMELKKALPKVGMIVKTPSGRGKVIRHNAIGNRLTVRLEDGTEIETRTDEHSTLDRRCVPRHPHRMESRMTVLYHHPDLLCERPPAPGARLHHHRRRRGQPVPPDAVRGGLLSDRDRRARGQGRPGRREGRHDARGSTRTASAACSRTSGPS